MHLKIGSYLQGGKYRIVRFIKSGGFGCTYEALHTVFGNRFAIKEFFPKDFCNRDADTHHVTVGTQSKKALVSKLKSKFIDEAVAIHNLSHPGIVKVSDVFEENGTAYYVMDYIDGCSLDDLVKREGTLSEQNALGYIRQVCEALSYVHSQKRLHLDIKPGNIMLDGSGRAILIDFGASKQYDEVNGENTSTLLPLTPGYAPTEQYRRDGMAQFTPVTDVYSLGATLYKLLTGVTPVDAPSRASGESLAPLPSCVSQSVSSAVQAAMSLDMAMRPQSVEEFLFLLDEGTVVPPPPPPPPPPPVPKPRKWLWALLVGMAAAVLLLVFKDLLNPPSDDVVVQADTVVVETQSSSDLAPATPVQPVTVDETPERPVDPLASQWESDLSVYESLVEEGVEYSKNDATLSQAKSKYEQAAAYERKYKGTKYADKFSKRASSSLTTVESRIAEKEAAAKAEAERLAREEAAREEEARRQKEEAERKRNEASYSNGILRVKGIEYPMVYVSGGSFDMGATSEQGSDAERDEKPVHRVTLSSYSIGKYEVSQELWEAVMGSNPSSFKGARRPVECVSWDDCQDFIRKLNELTGASFRLPTEAEWEFAARGGNNSRGYKYSGSNSIGDVAWYDDNSGKETHTVGGKSANELGLYDMSGNVYEWCSDCYGAYSSSSQTNPKGPGSGSFRVYRGGGWFSYAGFIRVSFRNSYAPGDRNYFIGLRLCH